MNYVATFQRMRAMAGYPVLTCVKPRAQWTSVPSGYTYDADYDAYINNAGATWKPASIVNLAVNDYTLIRFLPGSGNADQQLVMAGLVDQGQRVGRVLPGDIATVQAAQWLELDGYTYDLAEATPMPAGAAMWYQLRLAKR